MRDKRRSSKWTDIFLNAYLNYEWYTRPYDHLEPHSPNCGGVLLIGALICAILDKFGL